MKRLLRWLMILVMGIGALILTKNVIAKVVVTSGVKTITGVNLQINSLDVGLLRSRVDIHGLKVQNPAGFTDPVLVDFPEVSVAYDLGSLLGGKIHLEELRVHLRELDVIKNAQGAVNVNSLQLVQAGRAPSHPVPGGASPSFRIDRLHLQIEKVVYKDYTQTPPQVRVFPINVDEQFANVNNPYVLGGLILTRALARTTIMRLANINFGSLQTDIANVTNGALGLAEHVGNQAVGTAEQTAKRASESLKKALPFGQ